MPAIDLISTTPEPAPSPERAPDSGSRGAFAEHFQTVMGRALARSSRGGVEDSDSRDPLPPGGRRANTLKKPELSDASASAGACAVNPPPQPAPSPVQDPAADNGRSQPNTLEVAETGEAVDSSAAPNAAGGEGDDATANPAPSDSDPASAGANSGLTIAGDSAVAGEKGALEAAEGVESVVSAGSSPSPAESAGISGAKYSPPMQKAEKTNDVSGSAEQNLPGTAANHAGADPSARVKAVKLAATQEKTELSATEASTSSATSSDDSSSINSIAAQWPSPARSLERVHDLISLHALRLRDSGADTLQVVIKPGQGLQLALNLQMRDGAVEMQASVQRGNFEFLNLHWPELQQQLESRGVRLAALTCADPSVGGDAGTFQQSGDEQSREKPANAGAFAGFALNSTLVPAPAPRARSAAPRGWESWA